MHSAAELQLNAVAGVAALAAQLVRSCCQEAVQAKRCSVPGGMRAVQGAQLQSTCLKEHRGASQTGLFSLVMSAQPS